MIYNESFTIVLDDLSEYIDTHNKHLLKEDMLQLVYKNYHYCPLKMDRVKN